MPVTSLTRDEFKKKFGYDPGLGSTVVNPASQGNSPSATSKPPLAHDQPGGFQAFVQGIAHPFLQEGITAGKAVAGAGALAAYGVGKLTGSKTLQDVGYQGMQNAADKSPVDLGYLGKVEPLQNAKQAIGSGLEAGSYFVGGGEAKGALEATRAGKIAKAAITGAKSGAAVGGLGGVASGLENDKSALGTIESGIAGAAEGGLIGGATGGALSTVSRAGKPILSGTGRALQGAGEAAYGIATPMEKTTAMAVQSYQAQKPNIFARVGDMLAGNVTGKPTTEANTAARMGLTGSEWHLGVQANRVADDLWANKIAPALDSAPGKVNMQDFFNQVKKEIVAKTPELSRRKALLEAADAFAQDYKNVRGVSLSKLQEYKEGWAKFLPDASYRGKPIAAALKDVKSIASNKARQAIYQFANGSDIKQAYLDYGNLKSIQDAGLKTVDALNSKGFSRQVWEEIVNRGVTPVATVLGKVLYRTGQGLEFIGKPGAKTVKDVLGAVE